MGLTMLDVVGQLADLKDVDYKNTLAVAAMIELLITKGLISRDEFAAQALQLERASLAELVVSRRPRPFTKE